MLAAYVALLPVQVPLSDNLRFAPADLCIVGYLALRAHRLRIDRRDWTVWHALLVAVVAAGALVGQLRFGLDGTTLVAKVLGLGLLFAGLACVLDFLRDVERICWLFRLYSISVTVNVAVFLGVMLLQNVAGFDGWGLNLGGSRLTGLLVDPNAFGGVIVVALVMSVWLRGPLRLFDWGYRNAISVVLLAGLLFTFSRSAWIGLLFAVAAGIALQPRRTRQVLRAAVPLLLVGAAVVAITVLPFVSELAARPDQVEGRFEIIEQSIEDLRSSPVLGIGLGGAYERHERIVHNTTLFFLTEFGPAGVIVILGLFGSYVVRAQRARRLLPASQVQLAPTLAGAHAAMFGVSMGIEALYQRHWWLVFAALSATYRLALAGHSPVVPPSPVPAMVSAPPRAAVGHGATERRVDPPMPAGLAPTERETSILVTLRRFLLPEAGTAEAQRPAPPIPHDMLTGALRQQLIPPAAPARVAPPAPAVAIPAAEAIIAAEVIPAAESVQAAATPQGEQPGRNETTRHAFWGIVDQAASSGTNFLLTMAVAASVSPADFGAFSVASVLFIVIVGVWRSLHCEPLTMMHATQPAVLRAAGARSLAITWMAGNAIGLAVVLAGQITPEVYRPALQVLGVALPLLLVQDAARMLSLGLLRAKPAAINDLAWGAALVVALVGIVVFARDASGSVYLAAWAGTGALAGGLLLVQLRISPRLTGRGQPTAFNLRLGLPLLANYALSTLPPYLLFLVMPAIVGLAELGVLRAAYVPYGPFGVLLQGAPLVALPIVLRATTRRSAVRTAARLSLVLMAIAGAWGLFINLLLPDGVGGLILGDLWPLTERTRIIFAVVTVLEAAAAGPLLALRALKVPRRLVAVRLVTGPLILGGGLVLMKLQGADGAATAFLVAHALTVALGWLQVRTELRRPQPTPAQDDGAGSRRNA